VPRRGGFRGNHERRKSNEGCTWLETRSSGRVGAIYRRQWVIWRYSGYVEHCQQCLSTIARRWRENASLLACTRQSTGWSEIRQPEETTSWPVGSRLTKRIRADAGCSESNGRPRSVAPQDDPGASREFANRRDRRRDLARHRGTIGIYHVLRKAIKTINLWKESLKVRIFLDILSIKNVERISRIFRLRKVHFEQRLSASTYTDVRQRDKSSRINGIPGRELNSTTANAGYYRARVLRFEKSNSFVVEFNFYTSFTQSRFRRTSSTFGAERGTKAVREAHRSSEIRSLA